MNNVLKDWIIRLKVVILKLFDKNFSNGRRDINITLENLDEKLKITKLRSET